MASCLEDFFVYWLPLVLSSWQNSHHTLNVVQKRRMGANSHASVVFKDKFCIENQRGMHTQLYIKCFSWNEILNSKAVKEVFFCLFWVQYNLLWFRKSLCVWKSWGIINSDCCFSWDSRWKVLRAWWRIAFTFWDTWKLTWIGKKTKKKTASTLKHQDFSIILVCQCIWINCNTWKALFAN